MHFYERDASGTIHPRHLVPMTSRPGELRPTRLADAKKNRWVASVTTIQGMLDKPGLNNWRIDEHLKTVFELGSLEGFSLLDDFLRVIKSKTQEALDKAPQQGTDVHDSLEKFLKHGPLSVPHEHEMVCREAFKSLSAYCGEQEWIAEKSFVHGSGYAGKVDLHSPAFVVDWKSKNSADKWKPGKMAYPEMAMQLAAYRVGLGLDNARCANVFICLETGEVEFYEWDPKELDKQFANFADLLRIWLRNAEYVPAV